MLGSKNNRLKESGVVMLRTSPTTFSNKDFMVDALPEISNGVHQFHWTNSKRRCFMFGSMHLLDIFPLLPTIWVETMTIGRNGGRAQRMLSFINSWARITLHFTL